MRTRPVLLALAGVWLLTGCAGPAQRVGESSPETLALSRKAEAFDLQAHAGGRGWVFPGNVLPAFEYALDLQVTTLELDMNYTRDGVIIVIHDRSIPHGTVGDQDSYAGADQEVSMSVGREHQRVPRSIFGHPATD